METQNYLPELPYLDVKKLDVIEKHLTRTMTSEQNDFKKIAVGKRFSLSVTNPLKESSFLNYYQSVKNHIIRELHVISSKYNTNLEQYKNVRYEYLELVSLKEDKALQQFKEREMYREQLRSNTFFVENQASFEEGTNAQRAILESEMNLHTVEANHIYSKEKVITAKNQSVQGELEKANNNELKEKSFQNGLVALQDYQKQKQALVYGKSRETGYENSNFSAQDFTLHDTKRIYDPLVKVKSDKQVNQEPREQFVPYPILIRDTAVIEHNDNCYPDYLKGEQYLSDAMTLYGDSYAQSHYPKECPEVKIKLTKASNSETDLHLPNTETNLLSGASLWKCLFYFLSFLGGMLSEMIVFQTILSNVFHLTGFKALCIAFIPLVIAKVLGFSIFRVVKNFIGKKNTLNWKAVYSSKFFYVLVIALLVYTTTLGFIYFNEIEHKRKIQHYAELRIDVQNKKAELEINPQSVSGNDEEKLNENKKELSRLQVEAFNENGFITFLKGLLISMSSGLLILANAVLLNVCLLYFKSYSLKGKLSKLSSSINELENNFNYRVDLITTLRHKGYYIVSLIGQRLFIRCLKEGGSPTGSHFIKKENNQTIPLPLNTKIQ